ncbi:MAG: SDR family oxidoreductase [Wenzhouxiangellaceae bacterium]
MSNIKGKAIIVTGASSGIGAASAHRLAAAGGKIMLAARREERLRELAESIRSAGGEVAWQSCDVTDRQQVEALAAATREQFGRVDVLINNAGVMPLSPLDQCRVDDWEQMVDVNIKGVLYGIAAVLPMMREQGSGHVINLCSIAGQRVFRSGTVYCATKFAVRAISEGLRQESEGQIRVTNVSPGVVTTELTDTIPDKMTAMIMKNAYAVAIEPDAIAETIAFAIDQPDNVDINELTVRPTRQES